MPQAFYRIRIKGHLDQLLWSNWLEGMMVTHLENGETLLSGFPIDQAAFYGVLHRLEKQRVRLLAVCYASSVETKETLAPRE